MKATNSIPQTGPQIQVRRKIRVRTAVLLLVLMSALALLPFHDRISSFVLERGALANDAPDPGLIEEMIDASPHAHTAILAAWNTGKVSHREESIYSVRKIAMVSGRVPAE